MGKIGDALGIEMNERDYKPKSEIHNLREFLEGSVYNDFLGEMDLRIEDLRDFLEVSDSKKYFAAQGAVAFARTVKTIFENLVEMRMSDINKEIEGEEVEDGE